MSLFCWTQMKIFWRMWETEQFWGIIDFHSIFFSYYGSQWCPKTSWLQTFFKISSFVFSRTKKFIQVWNYLRVSKWWQNFHFWVNYPFNISTKTVQQQHHGMGLHGRAAATLTSPNTMSSVRYSGVKHATTGPWAVETCYLDWWITLLHLAV